MIVPRAIRQRERTIERLAFSYVVSYRLLARAKERVIAMNRKLISLLLACFGATIISVFSQSQPSSFERERGRMILQSIKTDLKKNYYDPNFHGVDVDARFKEAEEKIKVASSSGQIYGIIAQALIDLNDSHTFFLPPQRSYTTEYGWQIQMIGDKCYIVAVKPGSDADAKGLREGDEIFSIDGFAPLRDNLWKIQYSYQALRPKPSVRFVVIKPDGREQELDVAAKVKQG
jgi:C-terminal processing protease CtpA/Prc